VKSAYNRLVKHDTGGVLKVFEILWNLKVMPSAKFFVWRALSDRLATKQNFQRRGVILGDILCVFCGKEEETCSHILVSCEESIKYGTCALVGWE